MMAFEWKSKIFVSMSEVDYSNASTCYQNKQTTTLTVGKNKNFLFNNDEDNKRRREEKSRRKKQQQTAHYYVAILLLLIFPHYV